MSHGLNLILASVDWNKCYVLQSKVVPLPRQAYPPPPPPPPPPPRPPRLSPQHPELSGSQGGGGGQAPKVGKAGGVEDPSDTGARGGGQAHNTTPLRSSSLCS